MTEPDRPKRPPFRDILRGSVFQAIDILAWIFGRFDVAFDAVAGVTVKWFCGWSGRSNFWLAKMLVAVAMIYYGVQGLWDLVTEDSIFLRMLVVLFVPWILLAGRLAYKELDSLDKTPPSEAILTGPWSQLMKRNRLFWMCLGILMMTPPPRPLWFLVGFAGYVAGHINRGGKSVLQRAKEWLREKAQVLVPSPVPA